VVTIAQLTDTHIVREGTTYFGTDTTSYLEDAIAALQALHPRPDCVVVTGDLVNYGRSEEYVRFREIMRALPTPYFVVPGNHDEREQLRATLPADTIGGSDEGLVRYAVDSFKVRLIGIDANAQRPWPGAALDRDSLEWLERTLASDTERPTILLVHQPAFRTGLHLLDIFGFRGGRRLRALVESNPNVGRVLSGHIHCVKSCRWGNAFALTGPSTAPQVVPELFGSTPLRLHPERPGFAIHAWDAASGFTTTIYRRNDAGTYLPTETFDSR